MKKVFLTGATGTIGKNLIEYLLKKDIQIVAIVRNLESANKELPQNLKLKIIECDLKNIEKLEIEEENFDVFYHLAWQGTRGKTRDDVEMQMKNIEYTINAVDFAKKIGCKTFVGIGSQAEYGRVEGTISPKTIAKPETPYGIAKLCAGDLSRIRANQLEMKHVWGRIISAYGVYDDPNTMVSASIIEMLKGKSLEYTKAEQLWDYIYVEDVANALYLIGENGKNNSVYCIGSGKQYPLYKYIEEIRNQIDENIDLKIGAKEYGEKQVMNLCVDISSLKQDTGFEPKIDFEEGIKRTIEYFKEKM